MATTPNIQSMVQQLAQQLRDLAAAGGPFPHRLRLPVAGSSRGGNAALECDLKQVDRIGCAFSRLTFQTDDLANVTIDQLQERSRKLASRLTYLLEPIQLIEIDADSCAVQLRSNPPAKDDQGTSYYEIFARRGGEFELSRFRKPRGGQRDRIDIEVTREVLERLAADFASG